MNFEEYWDSLFLRAVALGCQPVLGPTPNIRWLCTCAGRTHAQSPIGRPVITYSALVRVTELESK